MPEGGEPSCSYERTGIDLKFKLSDSSFYSKIFSETTNQFVIFILHWNQTKCLQSKFTE